MRKILLLALMLFALPGVNALKLANFEATVSVDSQGFAAVSEMYSIEFLSPFEEQEFSDKANSNAASLGAWQADYNFFFPHFAGGPAGNITTSFITFDREAQAVTLQYGLSKQFARIENQTQRTDFFIIEDTLLASFNAGGTIVIPENTTITIILPAASQVDVESLPRRVTVQNNRIVLNGIQTNSLDIKYSIPKPIAANTGFIESITNIAIIGPIAAIAIIIFYFKRREIEEAVENYLVNHSEMKKWEGEDEIEIK